MKNKDLRNDVIAKLINVNKTFNSKASTQQVLKNVCFEAISGQLILLLGPSGSGKTTLLTLLGGMQQPDSGKVFLFGKNTTEYTLSELQMLRARKMGFVFQTFKLIDSVSVLENLLIVQKFAGINGFKARQNAIHLLEKLELKHHVYSCPKTMSQGEKQRVAIARALVNKTQLIIADEPTGNLNTEQGMMIVKMLKDITDNNNCCVVVASHDERITRYANRVLYLKDGMI
jgi:putative ABC transport system ATP-binding protein